MDRAFTRLSTFVAGAAFVMSVPLAAQISAATDDVVAVESTKILLPNPMANDEFGYAMAVDGDTLVVAARYDDDAGLNAGAVHVYVNGLSGWTYQATLLATDAQPDDQFGHSVAISNDTVVVGSVRHDVNGSDAGAAYVFVRNGTVWSPQARLVDPAGGPFDFFGNSVAIDGNTLVVGNPWSDVGLSGNEGSALVFVRSGTTWSLQSYLSPSDLNVPGAVVGFGYSVALSGDDVVIGCHFGTGNSSGTGSAYVFTRSGSAWSEQAKLTSNTGLSNDLFGFSVAVDGNTAVIGAPHSLDAASPGNAYIFVRNGTAWTPQLKLLAPGTGPRDFGSAVAIDGDRVVVGSPREASTYFDRGAAYVYTRTGVTWGLPTNMEASDGFALDRLGSSVAIDGDLAFAGSPGDATSRGSAYAFDLLSCGNAVSFGAGCAGTMGLVPQLTASGCPLDGQITKLDVANALGGSVALLAVGLGQGSIPINASCSLLTVPLVTVAGPLPLAGSGAGNGTLSVSAPIPTGLGPFNITLQALVADPTTPAGIAASAGLDLTIL